MGLIGSDVGTDIGRKLRTLAFAGTGYMIVNYLVRQGWSVERALRIFAEHRPPGIYKEDYIRELYKYNHEPLCVPASLPDILAL